VAADIVERIATMSAPLGTKVERADGVATIAVP
jgi:hypothetical protein